jgi:hypothetical protein
MSQFREDITDLIHIGIDDDVSSKPRDNLSTYKENMQPFAIIDPFFRKLKFSDTAYQASSF